MLWCMSAVRTQVYLTEEQRTRIDAVVAETGGTLAEVVRAALDKYLETQVPDAAAALAATFGVDPEVAVAPRSAWDRG